MKIGIDARMLGKGFGIARYLEQLILALEHIDDMNQYVLFLRQEEWERYTPQKRNVKKVLADIPWYSLEEQWRLPRIVNAAGIDLMHFPHFNVPVFATRPFVVTIHDLTMFHYPRAEASTHGPLMYALKDHAHRLILRRAVRRAACVLTTSEYTKYDLQETLGVPEKNIIVTYQAPFLTHEAPEGEHRSLGERYGIHRPYVLYVGAAYPHKNVERLLAAWQRVEEKYPGTYELILVGKDDFFF